MENNNYIKCSIDDILSIDGLYTFSKQKFKEDYFFRGESHNFIEVVCVLDGRVGVTAGKNVYMLGGGQMTVHAPSEFHAIWSAEGSSPESVIFTFSATAFPAEPLALSACAVPPRGKPGPRRRLPAVSSAFHT